VFLQIGLLTTMGLAAKNSILMTSFAFIFGVLPLALSTGPGANSRIAIGTSVIGGMLTASLLAIFYIPLFFVLVRRGTRDALKAVHQRLTRRRGGEGEQPA
jgi:multidrug efflux pump